MAKKVFKMVKLQVKGGAANPSPPVGPALGSAGVNIMEFCKQFNGRTQDKPGQVLPVVITVYEDKSFEFVIKTPPAAIQLLDAAKLKGGSGEPNRNKVGAVSWAQIQKIAIIENYIIRNRQPLSPRCLRRHDCPYLAWRKLAALHHPLDLHLLRTINDQNPLATLAVSP